MGQRAHVQRRDAGRAGCAWRGGWEAAWQSPGMPVHVIRRGPAHGAIRTHAPRATSLAAAVECAWAMMTLHGDASALPAIAGSRASTTAPRSAPESTHLAATLALTRRSIFALPMAIVRTCRPRRRRRDGALTSGRRRAQACVVRPLTTASWLAHAMRLRPRVAHPLSSLTALHVTPSRMEYA